MSNRYEYPQVNCVGEVTNDSANLDLVAVQGSTMYIYIENINFSVYEAAIGTGGKFRLQDTLGNIIYSVNTDSVKDIPLNFGEEGIKIGPGVGIQAIVYGAGVTQASVSVALSGHLSFR